MLILVEFPSAVTDTLKKTLASTLQLFPGGSLPKASGEGEKIVLHVPLLKAGQTIIGTGLPSLVKIKSDQQLRKTTFTSFLSRV